MKRTIYRIIFAVVAMVAATGIAKGAPELALENKLSGATVAWYISDAVPTADAPGTVATPGVTKTEAGKYVVVKVTPNDDHWTYDGAITFQVAGGIGGGEAPRRAIKLPVNPTAVSGNMADGTGYYY